MIFTRRVSIEPFNAVGYIQNKNLELILVEILTALEKEGKLKIVGGVYDLETGKVSLVK
jgi:carbonic anhydrase